MERTFTVVNIHVSLYVDIHDGKCLLVSYFDFLKFFTSVICFHEYSWKIAPYVPICQCCNLALNCNNVCGYRLLIQKGLYSEVQNMLSSCLSGSSDNEQFSKKQLARSTVWYIGLTVSCCYCCRIGCFSGRLLF